MLHNLKGEIVNQTTKSQWDNDIKTIKKLILDTVKKSNAGHITSSFSCVEILYAVYLCANLNKQNVSDTLRNRVIISKEHCRLAQVCVLAHFGLLDNKMLQNYCISGGELGHDLYNIVNPKIPAIDYAVGSLGHGLSVGAGIAFGDKSHHCYVLLGDAELQEGSVFEALLFIAQHNIANITVIIDNNLQQIDNYTKNIIDTSKFMDCLETIGFDLMSCNGHDIDDLTKKLSTFTNKPKCIVAQTVKGKGIEFLLNKPNFAKFHHSALTEEEFKCAYEGVKYE